MPGLSLSEQTLVINHLVRGQSVRAVSNITNVHRNTISRLGLRVGSGCAVIHDAMMARLAANQIELDEIWSFVGKKQRRLRHADPLEFGDQYVFVAMCAWSKVVISYVVGKRTRETTKQFIVDLKRRLATERPSISSDSFPVYEEVIREVFGENVRYGQVLKLFKGWSPESHGEDGPPQTVEVLRRLAVIGDPDEQHINTSFVERQNLTMRQNIRRLSRRTAAWSKTIDHHVSAIHLHFAHYNFCRVHETLGTTPAHYLGITSHPWTLRHLVYASLRVAPPLERLQEATPPQSEVNN